MIHYCDPTRSREGSVESSIGDLSINLLASVIAGTAVWLFQRARRRRRDARRRRFFGLAGRAECVIVAPRHAASPSPYSVNQLDVAAIVEIATVARECRANVVLKVQGQNVLFDDTLHSATEFCVGGPEANTRMKAHLATFLPGADDGPVRGGGGRVAPACGRRGVHP